MTKEELDALEALANAATPGPWKQNRAWASDCSYPVGVESVARTVVSVEGVHGYEDVIEADTQFIAAAREAVPTLIARVRELEAEVAASCGWCGNSTRVRDE